MSANGRFRPEAVIQSATLLKGWSPSLSDSIFGDDPKMESQKT